MARFQKGKSGNPGGRPKQDVHVRDLCRAETTRNVEVLKHWRDKGKGMVSIRAAEILLDRGWGKPAQALQLGGAEDGPPVAVVANVLAKPGVAEVIARLHQAMVEDEEG